MSAFLLYGNPGWGSAIVEAQLAFYGLPFTVENTGDLFSSEAARARIRAMSRERFVTRAFMAEALPRRREWPR